MDWCCGILFVWCAVWLSSDTLHTRESFRDKNGKVISQVVHHSIALTEIPYLHILHNIMFYEKGQAALCSGTVFGVFHMAFTKLQIIVMHLPPVTQIHEVLHWLSIIAVELCGSLVSCRDDKFSWKSQVDFTFSSLLLMLEATMSFWILNSYKKVLSSLIWFPDLLPHSCVSQFHKHFLGLHV